MPHEVFQKEDGTLGVKPVDQMMEAFDGWKDLFNPCMKTIDTKEETLLCEDTGSIAAFKTTVKFEEGTKEFSIRFTKMKKQKFHMNTDSLWKKIKLF